MIPHMSARQYYRQYRPVFPDQCVGPWENREGYKIKPRRTKTIWGLMTVSSSTPQRTLNDERTPRLTADPVVELTVWPAVLVKAIPATKVTTQFAKRSRPNWGIVDTTLRTEEEAKKLKNDEIQSRFVNPQPQLKATAKSKARKVQWREDKTVSQSK